MTDIRSIVLAGAVAALAAPAAAVPLDQYSSIYVFGDSLSDPGNLPSGAAPPSPPYADGGTPFVPGGAGVRFSDGDVWAEQVGVTGNFAFGGAQATPEDGGPPDLAEQIGLFDGYSALVGGAADGANDLAAIWLGANDLFAAIDAARGSVLLGGTVDAALAGVEAVANAAAAAVGDGIEALAARGFESFAVFNLPALEQTPLYNLFRPGDAEFAERGTDVFNAALQAEVDALTALDVTLIDVTGIFEDLVENPEAYGFVTSVLPCVIPATEGTPGSICEDSEDYVFFDAVHPTSGVHALVAEAFRDSVAPIPLPAGLPLLALGLGGLAFAGRRSARGRVAR